MKEGPDSLLGVKMRKEHVAETRTNSGEINDFYFPNSCLFYTDKALLKKAAVSLNIF
jgi:hypothetical protein